MVSGYSPPILYLTDDDDDDNTNNTNTNNNHHHYYTEFNGDNSYQNSYAQSAMIYQNISGKKRTLPDGNVQTNPSIVNWTKRVRNELYQSQAMRHDTMAHQSEIINYDPRLYSHINDESHSFHAFDWTNDTHTLSRVYPNSTNSVTQMAMLTPPNVMNVVKQQLNHTDSPPSYSQSPKTHRYRQHSIQKNMNMPMTSTARPSSPTQPSLALPLPTPTSSFTRTHSQRIHPEKNLRLPYSHSNPPPQIHHPIKPVYQPPRPSLPPPPLTHRPQSPASVSAPICTSEIRRQPLNGTGVLSAFFDSKCYRCNICKFKTSNSTLLLQHLFTHIFYCNQCSYYSYSHHHLYQHIFEKHSNQTTDLPDLKALELLYITRCPDGTFALCMDSSPTQPLQPPPPPAPVLSVIPPVLTPSVQIPVTLAKPNEKIKPKDDDVPSKRKFARRRPRQKKIPAKEVVVASNKPDDNPPSSSSTLPLVNVASVPKEKPTHVYVLMKHRRCYSILNPPCLHSLTLEYNICREHTIRHMCHTNSIIKRRKFQPNMNSEQSIVEVSLCLKSIVNQIVNEEDHHKSTDPVCLLPTAVLSRVFAIDDLESVTSMLKLTNKYTKSIEQNHQYRLESSIRMSNQHVFILSSSAMNKVEPSLFSTLQSSITNSSSPYIQTKLQTLPISCDNTLRFLKGHLNSTPRPAAAAPVQPSPNDIPRRSTESNHTENIPRCTSRSILDKDNSSNTSPKSKSCSSPCVIVLD